MIAGIQAFNGSFLSDLSAVESRISQESSQISSGVRVGEASDDPAAVASIIGYQSQLDQISQVQANLSTVQTEASSADGALQQASTLLDQLVSIAAQGANSTTSATAQATLAQRVQTIEQQLVDLANTNVQGRYIFGGDSSGSQPYTFNWSQPEGVVGPANAPANTATIQDADGNQLVPRWTAQQIFDPQSAPGTPAAGNIFNAAYSLGQALLANNQANIQSATTLVKNAVSQLGQATTFYGTVQNWITQAQQTASTKTTDVQQALSRVRDADVATVATQLSLDRVSLEAALSAHASLSTKSLFSYLG